MPSNFFFEVLQNNVEKKIDNYSKSLSLSRSLVLSLPLSPSLSLSALNDRDLP